MPVGDQPKDIYDQIKKMYLRFIEPEECVILNVVPADIDFSTSESMSPHCIRSFSLDQALKNKNE